jgi:hypothetical protein
VMDQPILFHKPNKKVRSEKKIDHFIPQTKQPLSSQGSRSNGSQKSPFLGYVRLVGESTRIERFHSSFLE